MRRNILIADIVNSSVENRNIKIEIHIRGKLADWRYLSMFIKPSPYLTFLWIFRPFHLMDMLKTFLNHIEITFLTLNIHLNSVTCRYRIECFSYDTFLFNILATLQKIQYTKTFSFNIPSMFVSYPQTHTRANH